MKMLDDYVVLAFQQELRWKYKYRMKLLNGKENAWRKKFADYSL